MNRAWSENVISTYLMFSVRWQPKLSMWSVIRRFCRIFPTSVNASRAKRSIALFLENRRPIRQTFRKTSLCEVLKPAPNYVLKALVRNVNKMRQLYQTLSVYVATWYVNSPDAKIVFPVRSSDDFVNVAVIGKNVELVDETGNAFVHLWITCTWRYRMTKD